MNELDKQIASLKGWEWDEKEGMVWTTPHVPKNEHGVIDGGREGFVIGLRPWWSTDDGTALELVDELAEPLFFVERFGKPGGKKWKAHFSLPYSQLLEQIEDRKLYQTQYHDASGEAATRPEAICRAYLAAREWMAGRKGA